jgi:hypothetical protein
MQSVHCRRLAELRAGGVQPVHPQARLSGCYRFGQGTFAGTHGNGRYAPQAVALCEIIATAIVTRFSDYSETQPIAVKLGRA